ncbi:CHAP domain-containing protein [Streptomyces sp. A1547]|nr:CHAP domain-containing protein [Streptomyces sp. A1547]
MAKNFVGSGPSTLSPVVQGTAVSGGSASYRAYVEAYLQARNKVVTGASPLAADATAESPHGKVFGELLSAQGPGLVNTREVSKSQGRTFNAADAILSEVQVGQGSDAAQVVVRASVKQTETSRVDGANEAKTEENEDKRFVFTVSGGSVTLKAESNDVDAGMTLSQTVAAENQLEVASIETRTTPMDPIPGALTNTGPVPAMMAAPQTAGLSALPQTANLTSGVNNNKTAQWAWDNADIPTDYGQDCTNFISKALYHGGGMKMRYGWYTSNSVWWRNTWNLSPFPKNSRTWSAAQNLLQHFVSARSRDVISRAEDVKAGDLIFFKWQDEAVFNHVAVFTSVPEPYWYEGRYVLDSRTTWVAQHGRKNRTTMYDIIHTYNDILKDPLDTAVIIRPKGSM